MQTELIQRWWHDCSSKACRLPREHAQTWFRLINQVVRHHRLYRQSGKYADQRTHRSRCRRALTQARWELMLLSMYGLIQPAELKALEELQCSLERSLETQNH